MAKVNIIGVPEHFNLPWHLCIENGEFEELGINLQWTDIPEGTGKMCQMLRNNETDLAVILTEGIVKDISEGNPSTIIQEYVASPLQWGIHVAHNSPFNKVEDLEGKRIAISRFGSGSHLMAIVHAKKMGWSIDNLQFVIVNTLNNAVKALTEGEADYFMWEHFMTKPVVDKGIFRRLGDCPTPWPSFMIVANNSFLEKNKGLINNLLDCINTTTAEFKMIPSIDRTLATKYNIEIEDIKEWMNMTMWSQRQLSERHFNKVQQQLIDLGLITNTINYCDTVL
ncbi:ABC transporter substrate-binding protein [Myroides marinus]|uniref:substrate-binding domain-containing protein n=1 Tax=Myroides TaxID=76831 RepID=UPI002577E9B7|nr:substrate-binding domain-containing protein [Myroides marinus]MDM1349636.1 ABC transporter substrate-binding protein [Myroides marinus]MDM1354453.1 ABC transporter substrate-binding protein [Myroides marinus]MDM1356845.1 ABC transporter substrate-binding protein [Myroides marinus]MDM1364419.1 ABC transporter substrate-binding protein [Myroides marinus]